jgi:MSHA pilin protein MshA
MSQRRSGLTMIELITALVVLGIVAAIAMPRFAGLGAEALTTGIQGISAAAATAHAVNQAACLSSGHLPGSPCRKVDNCDDTASLLQGGLPEGYTIAAATLGTGQAGSNSVEGTCTVTQILHGTTRTASFTGISAGN